MSRSDLFDPEPQITIKVSLDSEVDLLLRCCVDTDDRETASKQSTILVHTLWRAIPSQLREKHCSRHAYGICSYIVIRDVGIDMNSLQTDNENHQCSLTVEGEAIDCTSLMRILRLLDSSVQLKEIEGDGERKQQQIKFKTTNSYSDFAKGVALVNPGGRTSASAGRWFSRAMTVGSKGSRGHTSTSAGRDTSRIKAVGSKDSGGRTSAGTGQHSQAQDNEVQKDTRRLLSTHLNGERKGAFYRENIEVSQYIPDTYDLMTDIV